MGKKVWHVVGNGDKSVLFNVYPREGKILTCNVHPFEIQNVYATCLVDFKMMKALTERSVTLDQYNWILGTRPRIWMNDNPSFYLKYAPNVKEFYTHVPTYAENDTNFNCGMMACHYAATVQKADVINLYGFDTLFDFNMRSVTDLYLPSDRGDTNNYRLIENWRPIWTKLFAEFPNTNFVLHHSHSDLKIAVGKNVEVHEYVKQKTPAVDQSPMKEEDVSSLNRKQRRAKQALERKQK